jgi:hypothetical protein
MVRALGSAVTAGSKAQSLSATAKLDTYLKVGEQMARKTVILAALIALGLGSAFLVSTISSVSVLAETTNGGAP